MKHINSFAIFGTPNILLMKQQVAFFFFLMTMISYSQSSELVFLRGKVKSDLKELNDINVYNLRSESSTTTNANGDYTIFVKVGDTLKFEGLQIETKKIVIQETDAKKPLLVTALLPKVIELKEVEIKEYKNINAVSLGILSKPAKKYTPAERKLRTATGAYPTANVGTMAGGSIGLDPVLNWISGRTTMLKKEVIVERKERLLLKLDNQFGEDYFVEKLKIPRENVRGFWYYAVEDERLEAALNDKNKIKASFVLAELAINYLDLQKDRRP